MESIENKEIIYKNAIEIINTRETSLIYIKYKIYMLVKWILNLFYISWSKSITVKSISFLYNKKEYLCKTPAKVSFTDQHINIAGFTIPYEYIIAIGKEYNLSPNKNVFIISVLGKITHNDEKVDFELCNDITKILLFTDKSLDLTNMTIKNMYYHIKYNKINKEVIDYLNKIK
jgi:hypothetical protein